MSPFHEDQLTVAEYSAYHLRSVVQHVDGLTIARSTKLTTDSKAHAEDELIEVTTETSHAVETEFHGCDGDDLAGVENELIDVPELSAPLFGDVTRNRA